MRMRLNRINGNCTISSKLQLFNKTEIFNRSRDVAPNIGTFSHEPANPTEQLTHMSVIAKVIHCRITFKDQVAAQVEGGGMKGAVIGEYGPKEVLQIQQVPCAHYVEGFYT